ncbi:MAG: TRAP transporter small permease subunit [Desulfobacteraceae bacterium]|jgi:TRAP-type C4-dicarboxylate transport system permease small subunit
MQRIIQRATRLFSKFAAGGASLSMAVLFLIVFTNSLRRYAIGKSFESGEELPIFIAIYGVMFGIAWAYLQDRHIRFTMLIRFLSESLIRKLYIIVDVIMVVNGVLLTYSGWMFVIKRGGVEASGIINLAKNLRDLTGWDSLIWIGHQYPYQAAMVLGGILLAIAALLKLLQRLTEDGAPESGGG